MSRKIMLSGILAATSLVGAAHGATMFTVPLNAGPTAGEAATLEGEYHRPVIGRTPLSPAPEPAAWAMMIIGVGMIGAVLRVRRGVEATGSMSGTRH